MKIFLILAAVVLLAIVAVLYFGSGDLDRATPAKNSSVAPPPADFHAVTALLETEMSNVPATLEVPSVEPANAFSIKSRLIAAPNPRPEYQVLAHACELIIYADQEHSVRQSNDRMEQQAADAPARAGIHARAQAGWNGYRQQTDAEVKRLLASLQNKKL